MLNGGGYLKTKERHAMHPIFQDADVKIRSLFKCLVKEREKIYNTGADVNTRKGRREEMYISAALLRQDEMRAEGSTRRWEH
jgi:hypothetical protein